MAAASVARDCYAFRYWQTVSVGSNGVDTAMLIDFGVGGSGTSVDRSLIENIPIGGWMAGNTLEIPIHIPAGTRLCARIQAAVTSDTIAGFVFLLYGNAPPYFGGYTAGDSLGINTATSAPTVGDLTDNAYEQVVASTSRAYRALSAVGCWFSSTGGANASFTLDAGWGAAASEQVIGTIGVQTNTSEQLWQGSMPTWHKVIPAGSRLAMRKNTTNNCSGTILGWY
jgi:hypothetical protein